MNRHGDVIALGAFQGNLISEQGDDTKFFKPIYRVIIIRILAM